MDIRPGDVLEMKKEHPCGARRWGGPSGGDGFSPPLRRLRPGSDAPPKESRKSVEKNHPLSRPC